MPQTHDGYPARQNADGTHSTELSITVTDPTVNGGKPTNIPSLWEGKEVPQEEAIRRALSSGKSYKSFDTIDQAVTAAKARSKAGGASADMTVSKEELDAMLSEADRKITLEQVENNLTPEEFSRQERQKYRWSGSIPRGVWFTASDLAGDFNAGVTSLLGPSAQDWLSEIGIGRRHDQAPYMGIVGAGAEAMGQGMTLASTMGAGLSGAAAKEGFSLLSSMENPSLTGRIGADLARTIEQSPRAFLGAEAAGGFGSGAAQGAAQAAGASPDELPYAGILGGIGAGVVPIIGFNFGRRALNWSLTHLAPWLDKGSTLAAIRLQRLSTDPLGAAKKVLASPAGVPPGKASEDKNLMALEARILEDNPAMGEEFNAALEKTRQIASSELRDFQGNMRQPGEWERTVMERVAAPGTAITLSDPQTMLRQARNSFQTVYTDFSGFPVKPHVEAADGSEIPLDQVFKLSVMDDTILAADSERKVAQQILQDEFSRIKPSVDKDPTIDSSKLLTVRQMLRDKISDLTTKRARGPHITARILSNAESAITRMFQQQLPEDAMGSLKQIDDQYNTYRIVEQAVTSAGDKKLSPDALAKEIRQMAPNSQNDLRKLSRAGRDVSNVLDDPRAAGLMVKGQPEQIRRQMQSDFFHTAWDRSLTKQLDDGDAPFVNGDRYLQHLLKYKDTGKALGIPQDQYNRAVEIAKQIKAMDAKSPQALKAVIESGPATMLQLVATLLGAKSGQHLAGAGVGSSLVMAQFMSQRYRTALSSVFRDKATDMLIAATKDKELYAALLTKSTGRTQDKAKAAQVLAAWMGTVGDRVDDDYTVDPSNKKR